MKIPSKILLLLVSLAVSASSLSAEDRTREFPCERSGIRGNLLESSTWDFSRQWLVDDHGRSQVKIHGDTLVSETINGRRCWYRIIGDTIFFQKEEDRLTSIIADRYIFVSKVHARSEAFGSSTPFKASGTGSGGRFAIEENGLIDFTPGRVGSLILAAGDTLTNVLVTRERRLFTAIFPSQGTDSLANADIGCAIETYRWYTCRIDDTLPVALQRSIYFPKSTDQSGVPILSDDDDPAFAAAYLPDASEISNIIDDTRSSDEYISMDIGLDDIIKSLADATVSFDGKDATVGIRLSLSGMAMTADILDAAGRLYLHKDTESSGGNDLIRIDCSSLRHGDYIVVIRIDAFPDVAEKRHLKIH